MASEWKSATVRQLQDCHVLLVEDGNHGEYRPRRDEFVDDGDAFIRAADMESGRIQFGSASKISEQARARIRKGIGAPGDVLLSHKGTVGKVALAPDDSPPFVCSPQTTFWRSLDSERLDRQYLHAFLRSQTFRRQLAARSSETDMAPYVSLTSQRQLVVTLPPIDVQRAIARILGTLDDKIDLNRRMNETLEAIARAIFKSWFVDFDPVHAKAEGRDTGLPPHIADLFPDSFEDSELGEIPRGWRVGPTGDLVDILGGYSFKSKDWVDGGVPVVKIGSVKPGLVDLNEVSYVSQDVANRVERYRLNPGDLLIGMTGYVGEVGLVPYSDQQPLLNQRVGKFVLPERGTDLPFVYCLARRPEFKEAVKLRSHGTAQANVSASAILSIRTFTPDPPARDAFNRLVQPVLSRILETHRQSDLMANIRDVLLPMLISGELRVGDAERVVEAATA